MLTVSKKENDVKNVDHLPQPVPEDPNNASRRGFIKKTSAAAALMAVPALLTKFARASEPRGRGQRERFSNKIG